MMNFVPIIYEDELLYSVIARYQRMAGIVSRGALMKDVFGKNIGAKSILFPTGIDRFINNLPPTSKISANEIIFNHTMFPFYAAFLSKERTNYITRVMREDQGLAAENYLGIGGVGKIRLGKHLRYCPVCFREDLKRLGESYWRRSHQIVGSLYCKEHHVSLKNSAVLNTNNRFAYRCADKSVCSMEITQDIYSEEIKSFNKTYVNNADYLLKGNYMRKNFSFIIAAYVDLLRERELASVSGNLYLKKVQSEFLNYYPNNYLMLMQSQVDLKNKKNWLRNFVVNDGHNKNPLRHLLYLQFLGVSPKKFFNINKVIGRKTTNKNYSPKFDIEERKKQWLKITEDNKGANRGELQKIGKGLHTWIRRYDREWYDKVTPRPFPKKRTKGSVEWERRDRECLELAKQAVKSIMGKPGKPIRVTPSSITHEVGEGNWFKRSKKLVKTRSFMEQETESLEDFRLRKIKWAIKEMRKNGEYITPYKVMVFAGFDSNEKVKRMVEDELEKNHELKEWLNTVKPKKATRQINWDERDKRYFKKAKVAHRSILEREGKPIRISSSSLLREMGVNHWLYKPNKMGRTREFFSEVSEDINEFRIRKIRWAIQEMKEKDLELTINKVRAYAGFGGGRDDIKYLIRQISEE